MDLYNGHPNDPLSKAQMAVISFVNQFIPSAVLAPPAQPVRPTPTLLAAPTPHKPRPLGIPSHLNGDAEGTPRSSPAASPPPEDLGTPHPTDNEPLNDDTADLKTAQPDTDVIDRTIPTMPLEHAILTSIHHASGADERKKRDLLGSIMLVGGASKTPYFGAYVETRLRAAMPQYPKEILVAPPPRELDPAVMVWKGGSVFGKLRMTNDSWIGPVEYDRLGSRILNYKCIWHW